VKTIAYLSHLVFTMATVLGVGQAQNDMADLILVNAKISLLLSRRTLAFPASCRLLRKQQLIPFEEQTL